MKSWHAIEDFNLPDYIEALFVYRDRKVVGVGYKCGETCDGLPVFKVSGGIEDPTLWMPIPEIPPHGFMSVRECWELTNGEAVGSDDTWEACCQRRKDDIDKMKGLIK